MTHEIKTINTFDGRELVLIDAKSIGGIDYSPRDSILGTLTGHYIPDFDVEPFVEKGYSYHEVPHEVWHLDHKNPTLNDSFQSLLNANDIWMHNVKGEKKPVVMFGTMEDPETVNERVSKALTDWQTHQDKVVTKYIVLEKIK